MRSGIGKETASALARRGAKGERRSLYHLRHPDTKTRTHNEQPYALAHSHNEQSYALAYTHHEQSDALAYTHNEHSDALAYTHNKQLYALAYTPLPVSSMLSAPVRCGNEIMVTTFNSSRKCL